MKFAGDRPLAWRGWALPCRRRLLIAHSYGTVKNPLCTTVPAPKFPVQKYRSLFVINGADTFNSRFIAASILIRRVRKRHNAGICAPDPQLRCGVV
jgi:hypothetical protein